MSIKKDIEDTLILLTMQEIHSSFEENDELVDLIKEILLVLSSSRYLLEIILYHYTMIYVLKKSYGMEKQYFNKLVQKNQIDILLRTITINFFFER